MSLNVEILESSFEKIKPRANEFVASLYDNLFKVHPELKTLFAKSDTKSQHTMVLKTLVLVVDNLRTPQVLESSLKSLGSRHVTYGTLPEYYEPMGQALLETFAQYLQEDWTDETKKAWLDAYTLIVELMLKGAEEKS